MKRRTLGRESESLSSGIVKCIACGRALPALDAEDEDVPCQKRVTSVRRMTIGIVESLRSVNTFQRPHIRKTIQTPK
jgi:hypothetical protein